MQIFVRIKNKKRKRYLIEQNYKHILILLALQNKNEEETI